VADVLIDTLKTLTYFNKSRDHSDGSVDLPAYLAIKISPYEVF